MYGFSTISCSLMVMFPEMSNTTVRGPDCSTAQRRLPSPESLRFVTCRTLPPRPPFAKAPNPSAPGKASKSSADAVNASDPNKWAHASARIKLIEGVFFHDMNPRDLGLFLHFDVAAVAGDWQRSMRFAESRRKSLPQRFTVSAPLCCPSATSRDGSSAIRPLLIGNQSR